MSNNNQKYYKDIKKLPEQFVEGMELVKDLALDDDYDRVVLCGMGGSSLFVDLINDILATNEYDMLRVEANKGYDLPENADDGTLFIVASYSGNTEEVISCLKKIEKGGFMHVIITAGGKLLEYAKENDTLNIQLPTGIQPRLATGYFIGAIFQLLTNSELIEDYTDIIVQGAEQIDNSLDEKLAKELATKIKGKLPIIYSTDNNTSLASISKIKFNENAKTQAFWNYFPELNHNEMVGFTKLVTKPFFIIFKSKFTNKKNFKRMEVFKTLMEKHDDVHVEIIELKGLNIFEEIMDGYYFIDHVTYYLAGEYGVDPEAVDMVEKFKELIVE